MKIKEEIAAQKDLFYEDLNKIIAKCERVA